MLWHTGDHAPATGDERCAPRVEIREAGRIVYWHVKDNDRKGYRGAVAVGEHVEIAPRRWIRLFGSAQHQAFDRLFALGDEAAYAGYNLTYTGRIVAIGNKTVTVRDERETNRLSIYDFLRWNRRFDAAQARAENQKVLERI